MTTSHGTGGTETTGSPVTALPQSTRPIPAWSRRARKSLTSVKDFQLDTRTPQVQLLPASLMAPGTVLPFQAFHPSSILTRAVKFFLGTSAMIMRVRIGSCSFHPLLSPSLAKSSKSPEIRIQALGFKSNSTTTRLLHCRVLLISCGWAPLQRTRS
jgi:hypothetical protein